MAHTQHRVKNLEYLTNVDRLVAVPHTIFRDNAMQQLNVDWIKVSLNFREDDPNKGMKLEKH